MAPGKAARTVRGETSARAHVLVVANRKAITIRDACAGTLPRRQPTSITSTPSNAQPSECCTQENAGRRLLLRVVRNPSRTRPRHPCAPGKPSGEQGLHEGVGVEREEVLRLLPHPDEADRDAELALDREDDPALGGRIELRQDHAGEPARVVERLCLLEPVLAGRSLAD